MIVESQVDTKLGNGLTLSKKQFEYIEDSLFNDKALREENVKKMVVTISTGKMFDADDRSRLNIVSAILASEFMNQTSTVWRLADNTEMEVTLAELKEANAIALQTFGNLVGVV